MAYTRLFAEPKEAERYTSAFSDTKENPFAGAKAEAEAIEKRGVVKTIISKIKGESQPRET